MTVPDYTQLSQAIALTIDKIKDNAILLLGFASGGLVPVVNPTSYKMAILGCTFEIGTSGTMLHSTIDDPLVTPATKLNFKLQPLTGTQEVTIEQDLTAQTIVLKVVETGGQIHSIKIATTGIELGDGATSHVVLEGLQTKYNLHTHGQDILTEHWTATAKYAQIVYNQHTFVAKEVGIPLVTITLNFDGIKTVTQVVSAWNLANPTAQVNFIGDPAVIYPVGSTTLTGGVNVPATGTVGFVAAGDFTEAMKTIAKLKQDVKFLMAAKTNNLSDATDIATETKAK
jgi:hypothetical protein